MAANKIISVDLGGTKILSAVLDRENKEILNRHKMTTTVDSGTEKIVANIAESVDILLSGFHKREEVEAVCLGVPGTVNPHTGMIGVAPNLNIKNFNIKEALGSRLEFPVLIENDVNLAGLGIKKYELNDDVNNMLVVFVGTGIGSSLFFGGKLYRGSTFYAGEIGHILVGKTGRISGSPKSKSFENTASRTAIVNGILEDIRNGNKSQLSEYVKSDKKIKSKSLAQALEAGDAVTTKHIKRACRIIGTVLGSAVTLLNIDKIVLGGGVIEAMGDSMVPLIKKYFREAVLKEPGECVEIVSTKLGDDAPLYGGIALAEEFLK